jgi:signal transduction histidine kinase
VEFENWLENRSPVTGAAFTFYGFFLLANTSNTRKYGSTGLGLTLVKWFVEMHNGSIHVESKEGAGSTFTFTIEDQGVCGQMKQYMGEVDEESAGC